MPASLLSPRDVVALSFVPHLPRGAATSLLAFDRLEDAVASLGGEGGFATVASSARQRADEALAAASRRGIDPIARGDARYPARLETIFDPPLVLWTRGDVETLSDVQVAIVGSRAASSYGEEAAVRLASGLASLGVVVTSGLARGIDAAAHRGALAAGGRTIAVLGCGPDIVYPPEHVELIAQVIGSGAVVSEFPPGMPPLQHHFPMRNRIISGLSLGVVVVEASARSGALITADSALEQGREVMAVPGNVLSERHRGSHRLLKNGAALVESAADVLDVLGLYVLQSGVQRPPSNGRNPAFGLSAAAQDAGILHHLDPGEGRDLDAIAAASRLDAPTLLTRLLQLELQGLVRRLPGGRFVRSGGTC